MKKAFIASGEFLMEGTSLRYVYISAMCLLVKNESIKGKHRFSNISKMTIRSPAESLHIKYLLQHSKIVLVP